MSTEQDEEFTDYVVGGRDALRRSAYLLCRDAHAADDLVQTAVTKLYPAWSRARRRTASTRTRTPCWSGSSWTSSAAAGGRSG